LPAPDDMTMLMQRLRTLQLRLNSVDPGAVKEATQRVLAWRTVAGEGKGAESRRRRMHAYITGSVNEANAVFGARIEKEFLPRITQSFRTLIPEVQSRAGAISEIRALELDEEYNGRLKAVERNTLAADAQLAELRRTSEDAYRKLAEVNERFDQIWFDDNTEGVGGWRAAMAKVRAEKEGTDKTPMEAFREDSYFGGDEVDEPSTPRLNCPMCKERTGKRQPRAGLMEDLAGVFGIAPYRCSRCMVRFYRYRPSRKNKPS
jgi:hypothetical protein